MRSFLFASVVVFHSLSSCNAVVKLPGAKKMILEMTKEKDVDQEIVEKPILDKINETAPVGEKKSVLEKLNSRAFHHDPIHMSKKGRDSTVVFDVVLLVVACVTLCIIDKLVLERFCSGTVRGNLAAFGFMLFASAVYNAILWKYRGPSDGAAWVTGYVLEWALSMDNLFVFFLLFRAFKVPQMERYKALMLGIWGAVIFRVGFIFGLSALIHTTAWVRLAVGVLLIISGYYALQDDDDDDVQEMGVVKFFKFFLRDRLENSYQDGKLFLTEGPRIRVTLLFLVVCIIMVIDVLFAFDSVGAKTGQIPDAYINLSSAVMAMLSLRALFFLLQDLVDYFELLKYGICSILVLVGVDMIIESMDWIQIPISITCLIIAGIFLVAIVASVVKHKYYDDQDEEGSDVEAEGGTDKTKEGYETDKSTEDGKDSEFGHDSEAAKDADDECASPKSAKSSTAGASS